MSTKHISEIPHTVRLKYDPVSIEPTGADILATGELRNYGGLRNPFCVLGCLNNLGYVIMIASAKSLSDGGTALVFLVNIIPGLCVKLSAPYWFDRVSYTTRIRIAAGAMAVAFFLVGLGATNRADGGNNSGLFWQLVGVALVSFQCGLGEASLLAMAGRCDHVSSFSSGTGIAGPAGFAWNIILGHYFGWNLRSIAWLALVWAGVYAWVYERYIKPMVNMYDDQTQGVEELDCAESSASQQLEETPLNKGQRNRTVLVVQPQSSQRIPVTEMTARQRLSQVLSLWPYIVPLFTVYAAEYTCQAGAWTAIGFPVTDMLARNHAYQISNGCYQTGVLISRSSGKWFDVNMAWLWLLPAIQVCNLVFYTYIAANSPDAGHSWYYNEVLMYSLAVFTGLLGGAVYVHGYQRITKDISSADHREFALSAVSVAEGLGVSVADFASLWWQACLYKANDLPGAIVSCPF